MSFGSRLLGTRKKSGFPQADLADLLKTKVPVNGRYEREEATPSIEVALKLATILGVSLDYLVGYTDQEFDSNTLKRKEKLGKMNSYDQNLILLIIDSLIRDLKTQKAYS